MNAQEFELGFSVVVLGAIAFYVFTVALQTCVVWLADLLDLLPRKHVSRFTGRTIRARRTIR